MMERACFLFAFTAHSLLPPSLSLSFFAFQFVTLVLPVSSIGRILDRCFLCTKARIQFFFFFFFFLFVSFLLNKDRRLLSLSLLLLSRSLHHHHPRFFFFFFSSCLFSFFFDNSFRKAKKKLRDLKKGTIKQKNDLQSNVNLSQLVVRLINEICAYFSRICRREKEKKNNFKQK